MPRRRRISASSFVVILWFILAASLLLLVKLHGRLEHQLSHRRPDIDLLSSGDRRRQDGGGDKDGTTNSTFAACLLVMDDNHFLVEWLAFHYFTLPLARVVVAVDPRSATAPDGVLRRWAGRVEAERWDDADYMTEAELREAEHYVKKFFKEDILDQPDLIRHRARQRLFYYKCLRKLKGERRGWVALIDTDEFLSINYRTTARLGLEAPPIEEPGSVMKFLQTELQRPGHNLSSPCVQIPRLRFGAVESTYPEVQKMVPLVFNASRFQTLRWRKHAAPRNLIHNKISKTIIDLERVDMEMLTPVDSIHRPILSLCGHRQLYIQNKDQVFVIHHYLGSREQYFYRNDSRSGKERSATSFEKAASLDEVPTGNDDLRRWIVGFYRFLGKKASLALLDGVGTLEKRAA